VSCEGGATKLSELLEVAGDSGPDNAHGTSSQLRQGGERAHLVAGHALFVRVHLDTDFAGDTDDAAALVMLLGRPDAELVGITTTADPDGVRAGYVRYVLGLAGRDDIPVATGAGASLGGTAMGDLPSHGAYWGDAVVAPAPSPQGAATALLGSSVDAGATVIGIGPYTNLAHLEANRPGILAETRVVLMGGWVTPPADGLPQWEPEMDWNVQCDVTAALIVFEAALDLTLVTLPATLRAHLQVAHLARLEGSGPIGRLLARQARAHGAEHQMADVGRAHSGVPDDLLNFQYDPVACAVGLGWSGAAITSMDLQPKLERDALGFVAVDDGKPVDVDVVVDVDGVEFANLWLTAVEHADRRR